jgi:hypothetical protein
MSVTFWAPDAPTVTVKPYPEVEPEYTEERSTLPEVNLSNCNAREMLRLLGLDFEELCGSVQPTEFGPVVSHLHRLINNEATRAPALKEAAEHPRRLHVLAAGERSSGNVVAVGFGPRIFEGGRSDDYLKNRASALLDLFVQARQANYQISWG